jgi:23S rRNA (uridine2552-2'-O)-methyltransferase
MEIQRKEKLLHRGTLVIDLGAAPGGWSQYAAERVGPQGRVIAVDLLEMKPIAGVEQIHGDFADEDTLRQITQCLAGQPVDLVMSDMAPNISGNWSVDHPRSMQLAELALEFATRVLRPGGDLLIKLFEGQDLNDLVKAARVSFGAVRLRKPMASRAESREIYVVARNYRL